MLEPTRSSLVETSRSSNSAGFLSMLTVTLEGLPELSAAYQSACSELGRSLGDSVDAAAKHGRGVARNLSPVQTGKLANSIEGGVTNRSALSAEGVLSVSADHASHVAYGTRPHTIRARGKGVLVFEQGGAMRFARSVRHPGTAPNEFWERAVYETRQVLESRAARACQDFARRLS